MTDTSKELARRTGTYGQASLSDRQQYALALARSSDLLPKTFWDSAKPNPAGGMIPAAPNPGKVLYMTETAAMLGIHPMAGLTSIHIIEGKPSLSAGLWASLAREAGHRLRVWTEGEGESLKAIATLVRSDDPDFEFRVEWTIDNARTAGLMSKDNWKKYTRSMLKSRATTEVIREACPEVAMGAAYTPEELNSDLAVNEQGDPIEMQPIPDGQYAPSGDGAIPASSHQAPAAPEPRKEAPIPEPEPAEPASDAFDYAAAIAGLSSYQEALELHAKARTEGALDIEFKQGRKKRKVGEAIVEVGSALRAAEEAAAAASEEVVEAEIVDDGAPMAMEEGQ